MAMRPNSIPCPSLRYDPSFHVARTSVAGRSIGCIVLQSAADDGPVTQTPNSRANTESPCFPLSTRAMFRLPPSFTAPLQHCISGAAVSRIYTGRTQAPSPRPESLLAIAHLSPEDPIHADRVDRDDRQHHDAAV